MTLQEFVATFSERERASSGAAEWVYGKVFELKTKLGRAPLCIEVGVYCGYTSLPAALAGAWVICVDVFDARDRWIKEHGSHIGGRTLDRFIANMFRTDTSGRVLTVVSESTTAANLLPNEIADFVFIDANHDEEAVREDLVAWGPKVRVGGVLSGHDICQDAVGKVVREFCQPPNWGPVEVGQDWVWFTERLV